MDNPFSLIGTVPVSYGQEKYYRTNERVGLSNLFKPWYILTYHGFFIMRRSIIRKSQRYPFNSSWESLNLACYESN